MQQPHRGRKWNKSLRRAGGILFGLSLTACPLLGQMSANVKINLNAAVAKVPQAAYGVGMSVYDNDFTPPDLPGKLKAAGVTALRFPGGSYADVYHWKTNSATPGARAYINANDTFDHFMTRDVLPSGAQAIITVNYGSNAAGTGGGDPAEAAAWVRYANEVKHYNIRYWEIGNEVGGNGYFGPQWEEDLHAPYNGHRKGNPALSQSAYGRNALQFIQAMKAVDPSVRIGVGLDMPDKYPGTGDEALLKAVGDRIDFVIIHWYPKMSSTNLMVTEDIKPQVAALRAEIARYAGASQRNIPIAVTETNGGGAGASRALFATDDFLTWFEAGAFTVEWQEMHNGFLSEGGGMPEDTPTPAYYGMQMAALAARPGAVLVQTQSSTPLLSAHAVKRGDGGIAIVLINKHPNQSFRVHVAIAGSRIAAAGTRYEFGRKNFRPGSEWPVAGPSKSEASGLGNNFSITVPATSETVLLIPNK
jgi:alpha-L-arabinofuranosidase